MSEAGKTSPAYPSADRDGARYWQAAQEERLELQRCDACDTWRWPARAICNRCHSFDHHYEVVSGRGRLTSWVVTHQPFAPGFEDRLPYVVASVALVEQDDLVLIGGLVSGEPGEGRPVRAVFPRSPDGFRRLHWQVEDPQEE